MPPDLPDLDHRARAALLGLHGAAVVAAPAAGFLTGVLATHLAADPVDFAAIVRGWTDGWRAGVVRFDAPTDHAIRQLAERGQPPAAGEGVPSLAGLPLAVPAALATFRSPRHLLGTVYHAARLVTADESATWGAVAIGVAAARFLLGHRDFIPDVMEALRVNGAPEELLAGVRRVPLLKPGVWGPTGGRPAGLAVEAVVTILGMADREPLASRAAAWWGESGRAGGYPLVATAALLGVRDGEAGVPAAWRPPSDVAAECTVLAARLTTRHTDRAPVDPASPVDGPETNS